MVVCDAAHLTEVESIITAVIRVGSNHWYEIRLKLHLSHTQITDTAHTIPTTSGKLRALIETRRLQVDDQTVVRELLDTCVNITTPIFEGVKEELQRQGRWYSIWNARMTLFKQT